MNQHLKGELKNKVVDSRTLSEKKKGQKQMKNSHSHLWSHPLSMVKGLATEDKSGSMQNLISEIK